MGRPSIKRARWSASPRPRSVARLAYREPAPDAASRPPPRCEESGHYQALREHWLAAWLGRFGRLLGSR
ncbi:MAG: hypothetical protein AAGF11_30565 [Myxococcota bacterium]